MPHRIRVCRLAAVLVGLTAAIGASSTLAAVVPLTPAQRREVAELRKLAFTGDPADADKAIAGLQALGEAGRASLFGVVRELLERDRKAVAQAARQAGDPAQREALETQLLELRASARDNIKVLGKDETMQIAKANYEKLKALTTQLNGLQELRAAVLDVMARRPRLMAVYTETTPGSDRVITEQKEAFLATQAEEVLGMSVEAMQQVPEFGPGKDGAKPPDDPSRRLLWFYRACRRIEAHNETVRPLADGQEWVNVQHVNAYREYLGILPYEIDPRLLQSARRHSKEMSDKGYFSHDSPTPSEKSHTKRMANAGYKGGYSENIAAGSASGEHAFWQWFSSPPHHKNMVNPGNVHLGVGRWGTLWTQNMGRAKRLMFLDAPERATACVVKGDVLPPQGGLAGRTAGGFGRF